MFTSTAAGLDDLPCFIAFFVSMISTQIQNNFLIFPYCYWLYLYCVSCGECAQILISPIFQTDTKQSHLGSLYVIQAL